MTSGTDTSDMSTTVGSTTSNSDSGSTTGTAATTDGTGTTAASDATGTTAASDATSTTESTTGSTTGETTGPGCPSELSCADGLFCCEEGQACVNRVTCYKTCDPLQPECDRFEHCTPGPDVPFICFQKGDPGAAGDPCEGSNYCDPGLVCLLAAAVQGCGSDACCAPVCDLSNPITCPGDMEVCEPWFQGMAPAGYENLGVCVLPG